MVRRSAALVAVAALCVVLVRLLVVQSFAVPSASMEPTLHVGDRVVFYTDGIVEARTPDGEFFGEERLADFIHRSAGAGEAAPETVRQLMRAVLAHQADQLQDDASLVVLEWRTGDERRLQI